MPKVENDYKRTLWKTADALRAQVDAAEYKHIVLGLIFLKYISDSFSDQKEQIKGVITDPDSEFFIGENLDDIDPSYLEDREYYLKDNVFYVPLSATWETLRAQAKQSDIGTIIDNAMGDIEAENEALKGRLDRRFGRTQLEPGKLGELIDLISTINFATSQKSGDLFGEVYEYFLGQFASAEGKKGGQFYTPQSVVKTLVAVLAPHSGRVYDPCCGSGGMFVHSEDFVKSHGGHRDAISIYGQESNPTTWRLAAMNLAVHGISANLGEGPADTFARDQHPDTKFDYVLANPPFNISDWGGAAHQDDPRWKYGRPPVGNANYAWLQHILSKLSPKGQAGVVLANGSMSSNTSGEGDIRRTMIVGDVIEVMVALPPQLFANTQIPACLWFLTKDKTANGRDRRNETLFIDARNLGTLETKVVRVLTADDIQKIADTASSWRTGEDYRDIPGFCKSSTTAEIEKNGFVLTPGRYVGVSDLEEDDEPFGEKINRLFKDYQQLKIESNTLDKTIVERSKGIVM